MERFCGCILHVYKFTNFLSSVWRSGGNCVFIVILNIFVSLLVGVQFRPIWINLGKLNKICKEMAEKLSLQVFPPNFLKANDRGGALVVISRDRGSMGSDMIENSWINMTQYNSKISPMSPVGDLSQTWAHSSYCARDHLQCSMSPKKGNSLQRGLGESAGKFILFSCPGDVLDYIQGTFSSSDKFLTGNVDFENCKIWKVKILYIITNHTW